MNEMQHTKFPVGSEWRRWDLHIHSPESILESKFGGDWEKYVHELFTRAIENRIAAIGITDYFFIDGYKKLKTEFLNKPDVLKKIFAAELHKNPDYLEQIKSILILPNIELRIEKFVRTKKDELGSGNRLTLHILFSDEVPIEDIEEGFIRRLNISFDALPHEKEELVPLTHANLMRLGAKLKMQQRDFQKQQDLYTGCMVATVSDRDVSGLLYDQRSLFRDKYLIVLAEEYITDVNWSGSGHQARKLLYQKSHMIFSSNPKSITATITEKFAQEFHGPKPCIWGSDAHSYDKMFKPDQNRFCWIKSDVEFSGLRQVLNEPQDRCFIGERPPELEVLRQYKKQYIESIEFQKQPNSQLTEKWFDGQKISFNSGMVTIIGNKGGGKSALADTLALVGNPHVKQEHFSFLKSERFRHPDAATKIIRAQEFKVRAKWNNDEVIVRQLSDNAQPTELERVRYLPQGYLEKLCNPQNETQQQEFQQELDRVIFSHVLQRERLGKNSLKDLIAHRAEDIKRSQSALKSRLRAVNHKIIDIEPKITDAAVALLEERIRAKQQELDRFEATKPVEVSNPSLDLGQDDVATLQSKKVDEVKSKIDLLQNKKITAEQELAKLLMKKDKAQKILDRLTRFEEWISRMVADITPDLSDWGIKASDVIEAHVQTEPLVLFLANINKSIEHNESLCDPKNSQGYDKQRAELEVESEKIQSILDGPFLLYQRYLAELDLWQKRREEIIGSKDAAETLHYYEAQKAEAETSLPDEYRALVAERRELICKLYADTRKHAGLFQEYYRPVLDYIKQQTHDVPGSALSTLSISFDVVVDGSKLAEQFLLHINHGVSGTFAGQSEGRKQLQDLMYEGVFENAEATADFVETMIDALHNNRRDDSRQSRNHSFERQLRKSSSMDSILNLLCQLEYLEFKTALKFGNKNLQELSPGERGLLLLVFYLLIDNEKCPLIIDQPEENLDNQSVKDTLVPCMKDAKRRRQLFIVTHNPNIAVVCDSEQIVYCSINKQDNHEVNYQTGSIENSKINSHIVDILEGCPPAFENRTRKYKTAGAIAGR